MLLRYSFGSYLIFTLLQITAVKWTMSIFFGILPWLTSYRQGNRVRNGSFPRSQRWLIRLLVDLLSLKPFYRSRTNTRQNRCVNLLSSPSFLLLGDKTPSLVMSPLCEDCNLLCYRLHALEGLHLRMMALLSSALTRIGMLALLGIWAISFVILFTRQHKLVVMASCPWYDSIIVRGFRQDWLNEFTGADGAFFARTSKCIRNLFFLVIRWWFWKRFHLGSVPCTYRCRFPSRSCRRVPLVFCGGVCTLIKHSLPYAIMFQKEGGLLGSQAVAKDYEARSVNVLAMSQVCPLQVVANNYPSLYLF